MANEIAADPNKITSIIARSIAAVVITIIVMGTHCSVQNTAAKLHVEESAQHALELIVLGAPVEQRGAFVNAMCDSDAKTATLVDPTTQICATLLTLFKDGKTVETPPATN